MANRFTPITVAAKTTGNRFIPASARPRDYKIAEPKAIAPALGEKPIPVTRELGPAGPMTPLAGFTPVQRPQDIFREYLKPPTFTPTRTAAAGQENVPPQPKNRFIEAIQKKGMTQKVGAVSGLALEGGANLLRLPVRMLAGFGLAATGKTVEPKTNLQKLVLGEKPIEPSKIPKISEEIGKTIVRTPLYAAETSAGLGLETIKSAYALVKGKPLPKTNLSVAIQNPVLRALMLADKDEELKITGPMERSRGYGQTAQMFIEQMAPGPENKQARTFLSTLSMPIIGLVASTEAFNLTPLGGGEKAIGKYMMKQLVERYGDDVARTLVKAGYKTAERALARDGETVVRELLTEAATPEARAALAKRVEQEATGATKTEVPMSSAAKMTGEQLTTQFGDPKLSSVHKVVERKAFDHVAATGLDNVADQYIQQHGKVISADDIREMLPGYTGLNSAAVQEPASLVSKRVYEKMLAQNKDIEKKYVLFTGGGTGAGKSSGLTEEVKKNAAVVFDLNLAGYTSSVEKIQRALDAGYGVRINYVFRNPEEAFNEGVLTRYYKALQEGRRPRVVPTEVHVSTHADSRETLPKIVEHFRDDQRVSFSFADNNYGKGKSKLLTEKEALDKARSETYNEATRKDLTNRLYDRVTQEQQAGRLDREATQAFQGSRLEQTRLDQGGKRTNGAGLRGRPEQERVGGSANELTPITTAPKTARPGEPGFVAPKIPPLEVKKAGQAVAPGFVVPEETKLQWLQRQLQNKMNRLGVMQRTIEKGGTKITPAADAYLKQELYVGRAGTRIDNFERDVVEPFLANIKKNGVTVDDLGAYVYAKHAPERNAHIAEINPKFPDGGSGMTNEQAAAIMARFQKEGKTEKLEQLAQDFYKNVTQKRLQILRDAGMTKSDALDAITKVYKNYVPLKGKVGLERLGAVGQGFSVTGKDIRRAWGRSSVANNPVVQAIIDYEDTIIRVEKSDVGRSFLKLVEENPNPKLWSVEPMQYTPRFDSTGEIQRLDPHFKFADNVLQVITPDGKIKLITIHDKPLAEAMKNMGVERGLRALNVVNSYLRSVNTIMNPEFILTNFERDLQTALINLGGEQSVKMAAQVAGNIPAAMHGIWRNIRHGDVTSRWAKVYEELKLEGGKTGWFMRKSPEEKLLEIQRRIRAYNAGTTPEKFSRVVRATGDYISSVNEVVEMAVRTAAYD
nr:zeta toxin family protein [Patescibacteria group bacterium]